MKNPDSSEYVLCHECGEPIRGVKAYKMGIEGRSESRRTMHDECIESLLREALTETDEGGK